MTLTMCSPNEIGDWVQSQWRVDEKCLLQDAFVHYWWFEDLESDVLCLVLGLVPTVTDLNLIHTEQWTPTSMPEKIRLDFTSVRASARSPCASERSNNSPLNDNLVNIHTEQSEDSDANSNSNVLNDVTESGQESEDQNRRSITQTTQSK